MASYFTMKMNILDWGWGGLGGGGLDGLVWVGVRVEVGKGVVGLGVAWGEGCRVGLAWGWREVGFGWTGGGGGLFQGRGAASFGIAHVPYLYGGNFLIHSLDF